MDAVQTEQGINTEESSLNQRKTRREFFSGLIPKRELPSYREFQSNNPNLSPSQRVEGYKKLGRRNFLLKAAYTAAGLAGMGILAKFGLDKRTEPAQNKISQPTAEIPKLPATPKPPEKIFEINDANLILKLDPGSPERLKKEDEYTKKAINKASKTKNFHFIDQAFRFVTNTKNRIELLEERKKFRDNNLGLRPLTVQEKQLAETRHFHTEWVAICADRHAEARGIFEKKINLMGGMANFLEEFRPDLKLILKPEEIANLKLDDIMIPLDVIMAICWNESKSTKDGVDHALVDVGQYKAMDYIKVDKEEDRATVKQKYIELAQLLSINSVKYLAGKMVGSDTGDMGSVQFRGDTACDFKKFFEEHFGFSFNPYGLEAVTAACLMLTIGQKWQNDKGEEEYRIGWINGGEPGSKRDLHRVKALQRWNQFLPDKIKEWNEKYNQTTVKGRMV